MNGKFKPLFLSTPIQRSIPAIIYLHGMRTGLYRLQRRLRLNPRRFKPRDPLILRDHLSLVRTRLSNERTLLSYIRSALYLLVGGIALVQVHGFGNLQYAGYLALALSALSLIVGGIRFYRLRDDLDRYYELHSGGATTAAGEKQEEDLDD